MPVAVGYCRVSTDQQGESRAGLDWQESRIRDEAEHRRWALGEVYVDVASGKSLKRRPRLADAMTNLSTGQAQVLVVAKLDRLSRSILDFAGIMRKAKDEGWSLVALDLGVDTGTPNGRLIANIIMSMAEWERELIGQRTKDALQVVKARGVKLGRPSGLDAGTVALIGLLRRQGHSYHAIAKMLNADNVPTGQGGARWYPSSVRSVAERMIP